MSAQSGSPGELRARLAIFQNPYIFLEMEENAAAEQPQPQATMEQKQAYFKMLEDPHAYYDVFGDPDETQERYQPQIDRPIQPPCQSTDLPNSSISPAGLEKLLDEVLRLYKPHVARTDWARVTAFRSQFLRQATQTPAVTKRVADRLQSLAFSLMPGEKIEYNRAPAERMISELQKLLE
jgi:hypothetical protein